FSLESRPELLQLVLDLPSYVDRVALILFEDDQDHSRLAINGGIAKLRLRSVTDDGDILETHGRSVAGSKNGLAQFSSRVNLGLDAEDETLVGVLLKARTS